MNKKKLEKIISFFREEMMTTQSSSDRPGFSEKSPSEGPTAGYTPTSNKNYAKGGQGSRKKWLDYLKSQNGRRNQSSNS